MALFSLRIGDIECQGGLPAKIFSSAPEIFGRGSKKAFLLDPYHKTIGASARGEIAGLDNTKARCPVNIEQRPRAHVCSAIPCVFSRGSLASAKFY